MTNGIELQRSFNDNLTRVDVGERITLWFSYETIVAFAVSGEGIFKARKMRYSKTTARHLTSISGTELDDEAFDARLSELLRRLSGALDNSVEIVSVV